MAIGSGIDRMEGEGTKYEVLRTKWEKRIFTTKVSKSTKKKEEESLTMLKLGSKERD